MLAPINASKTQCCPRKAPFFAHHSSSCPFVSYTWTFAQKDRSFIIMTIITLYPHFMLDLGADSVSPRASTCGRVIEPSSSSREPLARPSNETPRTTTRAQRKLDRASRSMAACVAVYLSTKGTDFDVKSRGLGSAKATDGENQNSTELPVPTPSQPLRSCTKVVLIKQRVCPQTTEMLSCLSKAHYRSFP